jgi:hypothetical protein
MPFGSVVVDRKTAPIQTELAVKKMTDFTGAGYVQHASVFFAQRVA